MRRMLCGHRGGAQSYRPTGPGSRTERAGDPRAIQARARVLGVMYDPWVQDLVIDAGNEEVPLRPPRIAQEVHDAIEARYIVGTEPASVLPAEGRLAGEFGVARATGRAA